VPDSEAITNHDQHDLHQEGGVGNVPKPGRPNYTCQARVFRVFTLYPSLSGDSIPMVKAAQSDVIAFAEV
jgi:hypothetical protein